MITIIEGENIKDVQMVLDITPIQSLMVELVSGTTYRFTSDFYCPAGQNVRHLQWDLEDGLGVIGDQTAVEGPAAFYNWAYMEGFATVRSLSAVLNISTWGYTELPSRIRVRIWDGYLDPGLIATTLLGDRWFDL